MIRFTSALGAVACIVGAAGCGQREPVPADPPGSSEPALTQTAPDDSTYTGSAGRKEDSAAAIASASADAGFIRSAAETGRLEAELAALARDKASSRDVKDHAARLAEDQRRAERELQRLANEMGVAMPATLSPAARESLEQLRGRAGEAFDRAFSRQVLTGHREAVEMYEQAARSALEADVRSFATERLPTLREHLRLAEALPQAGSGG